MAGIESDEDPVYKPLKNKSKYRKIPKCLAGLRFSIERAVKGVDPPKTQKQRERRLWLLKIAEHYRRAGAELFPIGKGQDDDPPDVPEESLPSLPKRDMTLEEMKQFDGKQPDGRILMAVNGKIFDVTRGKLFYGPGGPYGLFAGREASRGLATCTLSEDALREGYDDLSDLNPTEMESMHQWDMDFNKQYEYIGKLIKPDINAGNDEEKVSCDPVIEKLLSVKPRITDLALAEPDKSPESDEEKVSCDPVIEKLCGVNPSTDDDLTSAKETE